MHISKVWIFFSALFIVWGIIILIVRPKIDNVFFGLRTRYSTKNYETWAYAQKLYAYIHFIFGILFLVAGIIPLHFRFAGFLNIIFFILLWKVVKLQVDRMIKAKFPDVD